MNKDEYLTQVREILFGYSDEIPGRILHSTDLPGGPRFKVRKAWAQLVGGIITTGVQAGYLGIEMHTNFHKYVAESKLQNRDTTKTDIDLFNSMLVQIIRDLETR